MTKQRLSRRFAISTVSLLGLVLSNSIVLADPGKGGGDHGNGGDRRGNEVGLMGPAPKAVCGRSESSWLAKRSLIRTKTES